MKLYVQTRCSLGEISEKPSCKLENVVSTIYKTISNTNIVFSNCVQMRYIICNFFTIDDVLVRKVTISTSLKKNNFSKILEQAPLMCTPHIVLSWKHQFLISSFLEASVPNAWYQLQRTSNQTSNQPCVHDELHKLVQERF